MTSPNLTPWEILKTQLYLDSQDDSPQPTRSNPLPSSLLLPPTLPLKQTNFSKRPLLLQLPTSIKDSISLRRKRRSLEDDSTRQKRLSSKKLILPQIQIKYPISKQITTEVIGSQRISKKKLEVVEVGEYILTGGDQEGRERGRERLEVKEEGKPKRASSHLGIHNLRYFSSCKVRAEEVLYDGGGEKKNGGRMEGEGMGMGDKMQSVSIKFEGKEDLIGMKRVYSTKKIKHHFLDSLLERMH